ncbi:CDP-diacylglycerol--serine O-phosphatidyltransferase [Campylobacter sp. VBCF_05 NA6]|uniref:CDP-diacylglycerol--serine O-phosphatidyltransferase n=1 Tax=unclassified Campylobacter TaxID=2593542 RepID=UPI001B55EDD5|nr:MULTISPECIES: CDP-diacylglycerol--serine O-phosphatidyltransferase [unclassified Campylobacter]MBP3223907.1 CDP-diacylglycerol--serine O-phosphatidyltransferase [Campylobacter sp.]MDA3048982.1 CDP-diacylglycerol--serine O-phosphatidyltransferase [Campylobacter sp. JMF_15 NE4]MDA3050307.1 CDP-diacylglycerol--serine O-phosphatidyltransferase [Campylobacter sp. JMF_02 ED1]MDA3057112.1 CDP-diacylglycerol--serine O-phosphatidyltransferase [Campylobacter sp. VBCF_04 NA7]MDA3059486.1 CDP-diacylgly
MEEERGKLVYILPNLFTAASIFLAMLSIFASINGHYASAIAYIIFSLIFDGLDGRVARLTHTTSKFGVEFDSLADIVAFGVAPAVLFYFVIGKDYGQVGTLISALYVIFGAVRLARFNVTVGTYEPNVFIGLPIPTAAITIAVWIGIYLKYEVSSVWGGVFIIGMALLSFLMVSNIRFPSFKKINLKRPNAIKILVLLIVVFFSCLYLFKLEFPAFIILLYIGYGLVRAGLTLIGVKFNKQSKEN